MKNTSLKRAVQAVAACALLGFGSAGWAAATWSNLSTSCTSAGTCSSSGTTTLAVSAFSTGTGTPTAPTSGSTFAAATLGVYSGAGLGVTSANDSGSPYHAMDNQYGTDLISFNFGTSSLALNSISTGYVSGDADLSVLRFNASKGFTAAISGKSIATLLATGWELVANISGGSSAQTFTGFNSGNLTSSWWLVSAYNSGYGSGCVNATGAAVSSCGDGNDYVKLLSVAGDVTPSKDSKVPEPGSLALMGLGLLGLLRTTRRNKAAAA